MTNKKRTADKIADEMRRHMLDLLKVARGSRDQVFRQLKDLEKAMITKLAADDFGDGEPGLSNFQRERFTDLATWAREKIQGTYDEINASQEQDLTEIADVEMKFTGNMINKVVGVDLVTNQLSDEQVSSIASDVLIQGAPSKAWWDKQAKSVETDFANEMRKGMMQGETLSQLAGRVRGTPGIPGVTAPGAGLMSRAKKNAEALVRTSALTVSANARRDLYAANGDVIKGIQQLSTLDGRTTEICMAYAGAAWDLDLNPIDGAPPYNGGTPRHWGCRSAEIPVLRSYAEILNNPDIPEPPEGTRASMDGEVAADMSFDEWLKGKEEEEPGFARDMMGAGKSELWKAGKITLQDLVGSNGETMTLSEIRAKEEIPDGKFARGRMPTDRDGNNDPTMTIDQAENILKIPIEQDVGIREDIVARTAGEVAKEFQRLLESFPGVADIEISSLKIAKKNLERLGAIGLYDPKTQAISIHSDSSLDQAKKIQQKMEAKEPGFTYDAKSIYRHELGHAIIHQILTSDEADKMRIEWLEQSDQDSHLISKIISRDAAKNSDECFCDLVNLICSDRRKNVIILPYAQDLIRKALKFNGPST